MVSLPGPIRDTAALKEFLDKVHPEILDGGYEQYTPEMVRLAMGRNKSFLKII